MMKLLKLALGAVLLALAAAPSANAWVRPEWVVIRWANADCKIRYNDAMLPLVMAGILSRSQAPGAEPMEDGAALSQGRLRVTHAPPRCFRPAYARRIFVSVEEYGGPDSFDKIHSACKSWCLRKPTPCIAGRNSSRNWLIRSHLYSDTMSPPPALRVS